MWFDDNVINIALPKMNTESEQKQKHATRDSGKNARIFETYHEDDRSDGNENESVSISISSGCLLEGSCSVLWLVWLRPEYMSNKSTIDVTKAS